MEQYTGVLDILFIGIETRNTSIFPTTSRVNYRN